MMQQWEQFGYLDYVPYADYLTELVKSGELAEEDYASIAKLGKEQGFYVAAVYDAFVKAEGNLCNADASDLLAPQLDFHPNKKGHALLAETVAALAGSLPEPKPPAGDSSLLFWVALPLCLAGAVWKLAGMRVGKIV